LKFLDKTHEARMSIVDEVKNDINGVLLLKDWLGDDMLRVNQERADRRSLACLQGNGGEECPHHKAARWWEQAKSDIAETIRAQLEIKHRLKMATPLDDALKMCRVCGCCMSLKIWTPIEHIRAHTPPGKVKQFPAGFCWQRQELESL
jgi:hypothetical protein